MATRFHKVTPYEWMKAIPNEVSGIIWEELYDDLIIPKRKTGGSSGYDIHAPYGFALAPGESIKIETGIKIELEPYQEFAIIPRSSMGFKFFLRLANTQGKIDSDYFGNPENGGHIFLLIRNEGDKMMEIDKGQAFAQGTIYRYDVVDGDSYGDGSERLGGLGSTD